VQVAIVVEGRFAQLVAIMQKVSVISEASLTMIAALHDVLGNREGRGGAGGPPMAVHVAKP